MVQLCGEEYFCAEPPFSKDKPTEDQMMIHANNSLIKLPGLPSHSQSVERSLKLVTEASQSYYGFENRHKSIMAKNTRRKMHPKFASKGSYSQTHDSIL